MLKRYINIFVLIIVIALFFSMNVYAKDKVVIDLENEQTFTCIRADELLTNFQASPQNAYDKFNGKYYVVLGKVFSVDSNGNSFVIEAVKTQFNTAIQTKTSITCKAGMWDSEVKNQIKNLENGKNVRVYCKLSVSTIGKGNIYIDDVIKVEMTEETDIKEGYSLLNGKSAYTDELETCIINDSYGSPLFSYLVSPEWGDCRSDIPPANNRYDIPGYQYKLNELNDEKRTSTPEHLFVFYFDNSTFVKESKNFTKYENIEVSIVENIVPNESYTSTKKKSMGNGLEYIIYDVSYTDASAMKAFHRVEFLFVPDKQDEGIIVFMYVYNDENHVDDILLLLRTLEIM